MNKFDVVIIGSGLGGLCCGYILSKEGYNVCIVEKNRQLGGSLQIFSRGKAIFDTGIHYIGGLAPGQNLHQYFKYFDLMSKLKLKRLDMNGYDRIRFRDDDTDYFHAQGHDNFVNVLAEQFPGERNNLQRYIEKIKSTCEFFPLYSLRDDKKNIMDADFLGLNTKEVIESITKNIKLRAVLAGSNALYAGVPEKSPFYVHALVINSYIESSWKCINGGSQIAKYLAQSIKSMGGTILNYHHVSHFNLSGNEITSVEMHPERSERQKIEGKIFISNIDISKTLEMVKDGGIRHAYRSRINSLENTLSAFIINIVFNKNSFPSWNYNRYIFDTVDVWKPVHYTSADWPGGVAIFMPASAKESEFSDSLTIMAYMRYEDVKQWAQSYSVIPHNAENRGDGYEEFKQEKAEKLIDFVEKFFPGFKQNIQSYYTSTPLTYRDYIGSKDGSLYGILKDCNDPLKTYISPKTKIPNLFLTGQNLNNHGVLGVTISSVVTSAEIVGKEYLLGKIRSA
ncbi:MAG: NAD(P)-binding protein [Bacteroidota bacterium]